MDSAGDIYVSDVVGSSGAGKSVIRKYNGFTGQYIGQLGSTQNFYMSGRSLGADGQIYGSWLTNAFGAGGAVRMNPATGASNFITFTGAVAPTDICYGLSSIFVQDGAKFFSIDPITFTVNGVGSNLVVGAKSTWLAFRPERSGFYQGGKAPGYSIGATSNAIANLGRETTIASMSNIADTAPGQNLFYAAGGNFANTSGIVTIYDYTN